MSFAVDDLWQILEDEVELRGGFPENERLTTDAAADIDESGTLRKLVVGVP